MYISDLIPTCTSYHLMDSFTPLIHDLLIVFKVKGFKTQNTAKGVRHSHHTKVLVKLHLRRLLWILHTVNPQFVDHVGTDQQ
jgi:hypothetical protein